MNPNTGVIRRDARPLCPACGEHGTVRHASLTDRWFGVPGEWSMRACDARACGALYLDPVPYEADLSLLYQRYYTHGEAGDVLGRGLVRRARLAHLAHALGYRDRVHEPAWLAALLWLSPGRREHLEMTLLELRGEWRGALLDVGCGSGAMLRLMQSLGWDAEGIDFDANAIAAAQASGLKARVGTLDDPGIPASHYAAVTSSHVLEHVPDPGAFLRRCLHVTRPGGRLALSTPNAASLGSRVFGARWRGLEPPRHLQVFTAGALAQLAERSGYVNVRVRTSARLAATICRETLRPEIVGLATSREAGVPLRAAASSFQVIERALLALAPRSGEELLLTAQAPGART